VQKVQRTEVFAMCRITVAKTPKDRWYVAWTSIMSDTSGVRILLDCWAGCKHNEPPATSINYAPVNSFRIHAHVRVHTHTLMYVIHPTQARA